MESREGSIRLADTDLRSGRCASAAWVSVDLGVATPRKLVRESETGLTNLSTEVFVAPHAGAASKAYCPASRIGSHASGTTEAVEYGLCVWNPGRWA